MAMTMAMTMVDGYEAIRVFYPIWCLVQCGQKPRKKMEDVYKRRRVRERVKRQRDKEDICRHAAPASWSTPSCLIVSPSFYFDSFSLFSTSSCVVALCVGISSPTHTRIQSAGKRAVSSSFSFLRFSASRITRAGYIVCQSCPAYVFMVSVRSERTEALIFLILSYTRKLLLLLSL